MILLKCKLASSRIYQITLKKMYYMAKSLQLLGIFSIPIGVVVKYPKLMDPKLLLAAVIIFGSGMAIEKYLLK